jgi:hypothetical protein
MPRYDAVIFDLLTALLDSWSLWNTAAGSAEEGMRWRRKYLELTYAAGAYRPYQTIVAEAAQGNRPHYLKGKKVPPKYRDDHNNDVLLGGLPISASS